MSSRRSFLKNMSLTVAAGPLVAKCLPNSEATDYWTQIKSLFTTPKSGLINFNTGSAGIMPSPILAAHLDNIRTIHSSAPYIVKDKATASIQKSKERLAQLISVPANSIAITRNTTEGINHILFGKSFEPGDEIIIANIDYPYVLNSFKNIAKRSGLIVKTVMIDPLLDDDQTIVDKYKQVLTPRSKLMVITYMTHKEGLILPVKALCDLARSQSVETLVDAAHAYGQLEHSVTELGCDYYATSLHKWLLAPLGTGLLYVRPELIASLRPAISYSAKHQDTMVKFSELGTHNYENLLTLSKVLDFHEQIGAKAKEQRLLALNHYFVSGLQQNKRVVILSDLSRSCGIVSFYIDGMKGAHLSRLLNEKYQLHCKKTGYEKRSFIRVSLNINVVESDLDSLLSAINEISEG